MRKIIMFILLILSKIAELLLIPDGTVTVPTPVPPSGVTTSLYSSSRLYMHLKGNQLPRRPASGISASLQQADGVLINHYLLKQIDLIKTESRAGHRTGQNSGVFLQSSLLRVQPARSSVES
jgi:hypothetical protein